MSLPLHDKESCQGRQAGRPGSKVGSLYGSGSAFCSKVMELHIMPLALVAIRRGFAFAVGDRKASLLSWTEHALLLDDSISNQWLGREV